jgi:hypothetical protein
VVKPTSPILLPLGSPGPITPLELEESGGYLAAGVRKSEVERERKRERDIVASIMEREEKMAPGSESAALSV